MWSKCRRKAGERVPVSAPVPDAAVPARGGAACADGAHPAAGSGHIDSHRAAFERVADARIPAVSDPGRQAGKAIARECVRAASHRFAAACAAVHRGRNAKSGCAKERRTHWCRCRRDRRAVDASGAVVLFFLRAAAGYAVAVLPPARRGTHRESRAAA